MALSTFEELHLQKDPLLIGNVWDAHSAQLAQEAGFLSISTSNVAMARTLGYTDSAEVPIKDLLFMVEHIVKAVNIPVSVDIETGYSNNPDTVAEYVERIAELGVVGITLEDGILHDGVCSLESIDTLAQKINAIENRATVFLNARTDAYIANQPNCLETALNRAKRYEEIGAQGIFIPGLEKQEDIEKVVSTIEIPLCVMWSPTLPSYEDLTSWGVKRICHGSMVYDWLMDQAKNTLKTYFINKSF